MNKLKEIRTQSQKMSQWRLAYLARVHQSKISLYENGLLELRPEEKGRIAEALSLGVEEIFGDGKSLSESGRSRA